MVKASDPRIGNIHEIRELSIFGVGTYCSINGESFSRITAQGIGAVENGTLNFVPVKLTKNILSYFGYERANSIDEIYQTQGSPTVICIDGDYYIRGVYKPFNYVHEFQNIYYFITGVELIH